MIIPFYSRLISALLYFLPWSDIIIYGDNIFSSFPWLKLLILPILPILYIEENLIFGKLVIFLLLFFGLAKNTNLSHFLRFNAMQALLLKLLILIFNYMNILIIQILGGSLLLNNYINSIIFIFTLVIVIFGICQSLRGIEADLPGISTSAKMQI